jgi:hypothetical protein
MDDSSISDNQGGFVGVVEADEITATDSTFVGNDFEFPGLLFGSSFDIQGSTFSGNTGDHGSVIASRPGDLGLTSAAVSISYSTIEDNEGDAAAVAAVAGGDDVSVDVTIDHTTIAGNGTGGVVVSDGAVHIDRSTIAGNEGTGVSIEDGSPSDLPTITIQRSTITENSGVVGGVEVDTSFLAINHSTIAGNVGSATDELAGDDVAVLGSIVGEDDDGSPNCSIGDAYPVAFAFDADGTCPASGASWRGDPRLGPLADNGGPTRTRMPSMASPALDRITWPTWLGIPDFCAPTDQRGVSTPQGTQCDVGAVERELPAGAPHFSDVGVGHSFFWEIECLFDLGATDGYADGTFRGSLPITRQAVVAWLWRAAGEPVPAGDPPFSDVSASHPFADAIAWAAEEGLVHGYPDGTFRPGANVQRQALAAWLWRQAGEPEPLGPSPFIDVSSTHPFVDAITWLAEVGITNGYADGTFRPGASITREAVAAWVCRADALVA